MTAGAGSRRLDGLDTGVDQHGVDEHGVDEHGVDEHCAVQHLRTRLACESATFVSTLPPCPHPTAVPGPIARTPSA